MARLLPLAVMLAALAGCGDEEMLGSDVPPARPPAPDAITIAALGDSITAGSPLWDPDPSIRAEIGTTLDETSQYEYWASEADPRLEFKNCGVFGERTDEIAQRLDDCAEGADVLVIQGGINDIAQGRPVSDAADDLRSMVRRGEALGLDVALTDVLPWNNGRPFADEPIAELNRLIAGIADEEKVLLLPFNETLADPAEPTLMRAEWTDDGDHPSIEGYRRLGEVAFNLP